MADSQPWLARWLDWIELRISRRRTIDGIEIVGDGDADQVIEALGLIRTCDPLRYERVRRDIKRIWVRVIVAGMANFERESATCNLDPRFMKGRPPEAVACSIVHEATHARLFRCGIGYDEKLRTRVEQVCLRRELAFAAKLPDGRGARRYADHVLEALPDLSDAAMAETAFSGARDALTHLGTPAWITRAVVAVARWRHRRRDQTTRR